MKQSSSTAQNMLIEEVKVRGEVFRTDALESENKGVQAFAIVIPLSAQEQWLFLSGACSSSRCCVWSYPAGYFQKLLKYTAACVGWSFFTCSLPPALLRALMEGNDGHEWRMRVAGYSVLIRSILLLYFTKDIATVYLVDCLTKTCLFLAFWGVGVCVPLPQELCWQ